MSVRTHPVPAPLVADRPESLDTDEGADISHPIELARDRIGQKQTVGEEQKVGVRVAAKKFQHVEVEKRLPPRIPKKWEPWRLQEVTMLSIVSRLSCLGGLEEYTNTPGRRGCSCS
jgi:hypothetical protein